MNTPDIRYSVVPIRSWEEFRDITAGPDYRSWAFRGQRKASWPLFSSLSRYLLATRIHVGAWTRQEERVLRVFKRKAHLYLDHIPDDDDSIEWLALMQHHGAPTRLLDFTWSPYVAAFYALERATYDAAIWAIYPPSVSRTRVQIVRGGIEINPEQMKPRVKGNYEKYFLPGSLPFVTIGEPYVMNQRLIAQSGTFVVPGMLSEPVDAILSDYPDPRRTIVKFVLRSETVRARAMRELYNMNITSATLFPDLDGLARSMAYELEFHWAYDPHTLDPFPGSHESQ